jgi:hypothetical protein
MTAFGDKVEAEGINKHIEDHRVCFLLTCSLPLFFCSRLAASCFGATGVTALETVESSLSPFCCFSLRVLAAFPVHLAFHLCLHDHVVSFCFTVPREADGCAPTERLEPSVLCAAQGCGRTVREHFHD